ARIKAWLKHYEAAPWTEPPEPWRLEWSQQEHTWGPEVKQIRIRARLNCSVWPEGLPQVVTVDAVKSGSSMNFAKRPEILELEVNDQWYAHDPTQELKVCGEWHAYKGNALHSVQLTANWKRISDGQPLVLMPGKYHLRLRLVPPPGDDRNRMVTSQAVTFRVVSTDAR
ncbi:MAG TPA: hypothetical protein VK137_13280, partial [Planctomycetaceae bacterium]|nr:hypothetical protein [Planctomycetaceae bacterium]